MQTKNQVNSFLEEVTGTVHKSYTYSELKTNMSPENQWLEDVFPTKIVPF